MKRSRIITRTKDMSEEQGENRPANIDKREGEIASATVEELVAVSNEVLKALDVYNGKGEKLGKIEDLMIDLKSGRIIYAVLSFDGFPGLSKLFAIPWESFCIDNQWDYQDSYKQRIVFNVSREKLEKAPGFDRNMWPREPDREWVQDIYEYYECKPYWAPPEESNIPQSTRSLKTISNNQFSSNVNVSIPLKNGVKWSGTLDCGSCLNGRYSIQRPQHLPVYHLLWWTLEGL
jgi:sporulation protein YlmC with PRC-barrel domain